MVNVNHANTSGIGYLSDLCGAHPTKDCDWVILILSTFIFLKNDYSELIVYVWLVPKAFISKKKKKYTV